VVHGIAKQNQVLVVAHGGLNSLDDTNGLGDVWTFDASTEQWHAMKRLTAPSSSSASSSSASATTEVGQEEEDDVGGGGGIVEPFDSRPQRLCFAHNLTNIGAKTLLLSGGTSFIGRDEDGQGECDEEVNEEESFAVLDLGICADGSIGGQFRSSSNVIGSRADEFGQMRSHHQTLFDPASGYLCLLGGGVFVMSFGPHYCETRSFRIGTNHFQEDLLSSGNGAFPLHFKYENEATFAEESDVAEAAAALSSQQVLYVPTQHVKLVKVFLEKNGWLDKSRRISNVSFSDVEEARSGRHEYMLDIADERLSQIVLLSSDDVLEAKKKNPKQQQADAAGAASDEERKKKKDAKKEKRRLATESGEAAILVEMAIPITESFSTAICTSPMALDAKDKEHLYSCLHSLCLCVGSQRNLAAKSIVTNCSRKALEFLTEIARRESFSSEASKVGVLGALPRKYEVVGDVLMIPEDTLTKHGWEELLASSRASSIWTQLAAGFGLKRVARRAKIDSGPKRESHVRLLLPPLGQPAESGPGEAGWVEVLENGIRFGFDITRVMFCSGNVTERMRMGKQARLKDSVVVDLYCGIGYYTIPFLLQGQAAHVHACEWNPHSLTALRANLLAAGVADRCTVHAGNNADTAPSLADCADRVSLGLLPSSVNGWPLAALVLKPSGGIMHVHECVHEAEIDSWVANLVSKMSFLLSEKQQKGEGKESLVVRCVHVERVKSYAPRVIHIVVDLECFHEH